MITASGASGVLSLVAGLLTLPIAVHTAGAESYGLWVMMIAMSLLLNQSDLGIGTAVTYRLAHSGLDLDTPIISREARETFATGFAWMTAAGAVAGAVYWASLTILSGRPELGGILAQESCLGLLGAVPLVLLPLRLYSCALQASGHWVLERGFLSFSLIVRIGGTVVCAVLRTGIAGIALVEATALLLPSLCAMGFVAYRTRSVFWRGRVSWTAYRSMMSYGVRVFLAAAMGSVILQADAIIIGAVVSASAVTWYAAASRVYLASRQVLNWVCEPCFPYLTRLARRDARGAARVALGVVHAVTLLGSAVGLCLVLSADSIIEVWMGIPGVPVREVAACLALLGGSLVLNSIHLGAYVPLLALGRPGALLRLHLIWGLANVAVSIALGSRMGIVGVALGTILPLLFLEPLYAVKICRELQVGVRALSRQVLAWTVLPFGLCLAAGKAGLWLVQENAQGVPYLRVAVGLLAGGGTLALGYLWRSDTPLESFLSAFWGQSRSDAPLPERVAMGDGMRID